MDQGHATPAHLHKVDGTSAGPHRCRVVDGCCTWNACRLQTDAPAEKEEIDFRSYYDPLHDTLKKKIAAADRPVGASDPHRCPPTPGTASWLEARAWLVCTAHRRCGGKDALQVTNSSIGRRRRRQSFDRPWFLMDYNASSGTPSGVFGEKNVAARTEHFLGWLS